MAGEEEVMEEEEDLVEISSVGIPTLLIIGIGVILLMKIGRPRMRGDHRMAVEEEAGAEV